MAKFKVGDKVTYWVFDEKLNGTIKAIRGGKAEVVQGNEKAGLTFRLKDLEAWNACRNAVVANALKATNAAYLKTADLGTGNWEATVYLRDGEISLEKGDYRTDDYVDLSGPIAEIKRKVQGKATGKDLSDAMSILARAEKEIEKYWKSERSHGRRPANACGMARNAFLATQKDVTRLCDKGIRDAQKLIKIVNEWKRDVEKYKSNPNLQDQYAQDEYERIEGLCQGFADALRAMGW